MNIIDHYAIFISNLPAIYFIYPQLTAAHTLGGVLDGTDFANTTKDAL